jgi:hypothetical protein
LIQKSGLGILLPPASLPNHLLRSGADNAASSIVSFQPTILKSLGYTSAEAQIHTIPVYIVALCSLLTCAYLSGKLNHRYGFLFFGAILGIIGWSIELAVPLKSISARYFGMFAITASAYIQMPLLVVWISNNMGGNAKAALYDRTWQLWEFGKQ